VESFNNRLRDECLNEHVFGSLTEARRLIEAWREGYNAVRPHGSLCGRTPEEFARYSARAKDRAEGVALLGGSAPRPDSPQPQNVQKDFSILYSAGRLDRKLAG
jgi:putative transposase